MDGFLKEVQESSSSISQPQGLETLSGAGRGCQLGGKNYERLRKLLSEWGPKDDFGGLRQEPRDGLGADTTPQAFHSPLVLSRSTAEL